ncbi:MAG: hypothetical protein KDE19_14250 [Caldilineaceae bacterium]|nr:hypothetical protein [Caldilineaceae bacterium]
MHPMSHEYHTAQVERLLAAFTPFARLSQAMLPKLYLAAGERVFAGYEPAERRYLVINGEVVIFRDGWPVDLVEEGEIVDLHLWPGTTAVARRSSTLVLLPTISVDNPV